LLLLVVVVHGESTSFDDQPLPSQQQAMYGKMWVAACATDNPVPSCGLYAIDLAHNPATVSKYFKWTPPISHPFDQEACSAIDLSRKEIWIFEGDCNGQIYRISLTNNSTFSIITLPNPAVCPAELIYDIQTDMVYLIGSTASSVTPVVSWFIAIDPQTNRVTKMTKLATTQRTGPRPLHPWNSDCTIDGSRGTFITTFCCSPLVEKERNFINISLATGQITGFTKGGFGILQTRYRNDIFYGYAFGSLVAIDLGGSGNINTLLKLPNNADSSNQLTGVWSPFLSDKVSFVQLWHTSRDKYFVTVVTDNKNIEVLPVLANRFTFAPQGNAPFPWRPTFFFESQYQPVGF